MSHKGYTNTPSESSSKRGLEKTDPVRYWKQMRENRMNVQMSLTSGNFHKNNSKRASKYHHPPKTLVNGNTSTPISNKGIYTSKQRDSQIQMSYDRDGLSRSSIKHELTGSKFRNRQSLTRGGGTYLSSQKVHLNSRGHNYVTDKYIKKTRTSKASDRFSSTMGGAGSRTPIQNNRYNAYSGRYSKGKSNLKDYLNGKNSFLKQQKSDYLNKSRHNNSSNSRRHHLSNRYDSDMIESKYIHGGQVYDSHSKEPRPFDEELVDLKESMKNSSQLFKSLEMDINKLDSKANYRREKQSMRDLENKRSSVAKKYNKLNLESIQERVLLNSRTESDQIGSTVRYMEKRAQKQYNSGETSSMDSKDDYDRESNSSLALSYGNLENNLDKFNDKLQDLENKLNNIELSRTQRKAQETGLVPSTSHRHQNKTIEFPTASTGEHGTKIEYGRAAINLSSRDAKMSTRSRMSHKNASPSKKYNQKPGLKLSYRKRKSTRGLERSKTGLNKSSRNPYSSKSKRQSNRNKYSRSSSHFDITQNKYSSQYKAMKHNEEKDELDEEEEVDEQKQERGHSTYAKRSSNRQFDLQGDSKLDKNVFHTVSEVQQPNKRKHSHQSPELSSTYSMLKNEDIHLESRNQRISKSRSRVAIPSEDDMSRQKQALEDQKQKEMAKYGAKPALRESNRSSLSTNIKHSRIQNKYTRGKIPKVPNKYSSKGAFSKSYSNLNHKYFGGIDQDDISVGSSTPKYSKTSKLSNMISNIQRRGSNGKSEQRMARKSSSANFSQVSCLERIAQEIYSKKRVSPNTAFGKFLSDSKDQLILAKRAQQHMKHKRFPGDKIRLKRDFKKLKTVLLDLDETLIHSEEWVRGKKYDIEVEIDIDDGNTDKIGVFIRPYCDEFLSRLSDKHELVIFTASRQDYADLVIDKIDPKGKYITHRLYRQHCVVFEDLYLKDLRLLSNRKKEDLIIIDNLIYSFATDLGNGIPIKPYYEGKEDYELIYIAEQLEELKSFQDCPSYLESKFKFSRFYKYI